MLICVQLGQSWGQKLAHVLEIDAQSRWHLPVRRISDASYEMNVAVLQRGESAMEQ